MVLLVGGSLWITVKCSWPMSFLRMAYCMFGNRSEWKSLYSYSTGGMQSKSKVAAVDMRRRAAALKMFPNYYTSCFYRLRKQELPVEVRSQSSAPALLVWSQTVFFHGVFIWRSLDCWCIYKAIRYKGNFIQRLNYSPFSYLTNLFPFQDFSFYYLIIVIGCF